MRLSIFLHLGNCSWNC